MNSRKTNSVYNESYSVFSTINGNTNKSLTVPRSAAHLRTPSPVSIDAELLDLKKRGRDYHVSVNLNSLVSQNHIRPSSRGTLAQSNLANQQTWQSFNAESCDNFQTYSKLNGHRTAQIPDGSHYAPGSSRKTVLNLNGSDDTDLYLLHQKLQNEKNLSASEKMSASSNKNFSLSLMGASPPQRTALVSEGHGYAVKSVSSSNVNHLNKRQNRNEEVEFDLHLKGKVQREVPVQKSKTWEVVGTVPIRYKQETSRSGARVIDDDDDEDEADDTMTSRRTVVKDTAKELEDLLMSHPFIRDTPGRDVKVEREKDSIGPLDDQQSEGLINVDIITERVELVLENGRARILVKVRCERIVPLEDSEGLFKKSGVRVIKSMNFDMTETDDRVDLYEYAIQKQNNSSNGQLNQQEILELYKSLMQLITSETSSHSRSMRTTNYGHSASMNNTRGADRQQRRTGHSHEYSSRTMAGNSLRLKGAEFSTFAWDKQTDHGQGTETFVKQSKVK